MVLVRIFGGQPQPDRLLSVIVGRQMMDGSAWHGPDMCVLVATLFVSRQKKGFTAEHLQQTLTAYEDLSVWRLNATRTKISLV